MKNYDGKVLIVHGTSDNVAPISYSRRAIETFKDARLKEIPGAGHGFRGAQQEEFYPKDAYKWTAEITIYLDEKARGKGVGEKLYNELEKQLYDRGICRLTSCIAYPDEGSVSFHEKRGFRKVAHFEKVGYKFNRWYDVVWYQKDIREDIK